MSIFCAAEKGGIEYPRSFSLRFPMPIGTKKTARILYPALFGHPYAWALAIDTPPLAKGDEGGFYSSNLFLKISPRPSFPKRGLQITIFFVANPAGFSDEF